MNEVINFPTNNPLSVPTNGKVKTIKDFRKKLKEYDVSKLTYSSILGVYKSEDCDPQKNPDDLNKLIDSKYFNVKFNKRTKTEEVSLGVKDASNSYRGGYVTDWIKKNLKKKGINSSSYMIGSRVQFWEIQGGLLEGRINPEFKPYYRSRDYWSPSFTSTILVTYEDEIVLVCYGRKEPKKPLLRNFIRETIDVSITNNLKEIHTKKTFKIPVVTKTYEIKEVTALTLTDAQNMVKTSLPQKETLDEIMKPLKEFFPYANGSGWSDPLRPDQYVRGEFDGRQTLHDANYREHSEETFAEITRSFDEYCDLLKVEVEKKVREMTVERENKKTTTP